ncbi:hypothetical protein [Vibrio rhodolitus]|uniref:hypothetical protein n=1 Tax=Vibrio rhodolitus TaxID=2231649 RepID=UPI000E0AADDE|nr:hypothetical protein [Vibrio rhodolitus]
MMRGLVVISSLVVVAMVMVLTKPSDEGLELAQCDITPIIDTEVSFIVDKEVLNKHDEASVRDFLAKSIQHSNLILSNSCIPTTRSLGEITYIELDKSNISDIYTLHKQLEIQMGIDDLDQSYPAANQFYGFVFTRQTADYIGYAGEAEVNLSRKFFAMTFNNGLHLVEHEIGHLSWAQHKEGHPHNLGVWLESTILPEFHHLLKPYARGYKCGTAGTIMSYEEIRLPIYSSPNIFNQGKACGDPETADNARAMTEHAYRIAQAMAKEAS